MFNLSRAVFLASLFIWSLWFGGSAAEKIDINTAPSEELVKIIHIGETRALELISLRPFSSLDELAKIKGIGEKRIEDIKKQGLAWVGATPSPKISTEEKFQSLADSEKEEVKIIYPSGIIINEILPSSEGADEENEWIEIFNQNGFEVDLADWKISDTTGTINTFVLSAGTKIKPYGFLVFPRPQTKITLNNNGDALKLISPDNRVASAVEYKNAPSGSSYNSANDGWVWSKSLTPGTLNQTLPPLDKKTDKTTKDQKQNQITEKRLASAGAQLPKNPNYPLLIAALFVAVISGISFLLFKKFATK